MRTFIFAMLLGSNVALASTVEDIVREGIKLHDAGKYDLAVEKYKEALNLEPSNVEVLYEMVFSYQAAGNNKQCIQLADKGLKLEPKYRNNFFATKGSCQSQEGDYDDAIKTFEQGMKEFPGDPMLHFNVGITLYKSGNIREAIVHFKKTIELKPAYPSPYYLLAQSFHRTGYRIPAVYFYMQFVLLEPSTERSSDASKKLFALIMQPVSKNEKGDVNINVSVDGPIDEGDFTGQDMMLSIGASMISDEEVKKVDGMLPVVMNLKALAEMSKDEKSEKLKTTFTWKYAIQNIVALEAKGNLEPLSYILAANAGMEGADSWIEQNQERITAMLSQRKDLPSLAAAN